MPIHAKTFLVKAAPINIFVSAMGKKRCNIKSVTRTYKPTENHPQTLQFSLSSIECFSIFKLIVLVFQPTLLFWFTLTIWIDTLSRVCKQFWHTHFMLSAQHQTVDRES